MSADTWEWKGEEVATLGDLFTALSNLQNEQEGQEFMRHYMAHLRRFPDEVPNPESVAFQNVGYVSRYGDDVTYERIRRFTGAQHPIFG